MPNEEFKLVAAGNAASDCYTVYWPRAKDLARVVHKIMMRKKRNEANDSDIVQECAFHGLLIYDLVIDNSLYPRLHSVPPLLGLEMQSLGSEMQMLSRVLEPPSVLVAQGPLGTVASSSAPWRLRSYYDLEEGGQANRVGGGAAAPVQQPSEVSQRLDAVMVQAYGPWAAV